MTEQPSLNDISSWRILIVDDEPDNLKLASEFLAFSGATVTTAETGTQALALVAEAKPTVILLDLSMPGVDGWEVQRQLRQQPALDRVPIIALTALAMPEDRARAETAGFDGYITKPFRVGSLVRDLVGSVRAFNAKHAAQPPQPPTANNAQHPTQPSQQPTGDTNEQSIPG